MRNSKKNILLKTLSCFLALMSVVGILASLSLLPVFAANEADDEEIIAFDQYYKKYYTDPDSDQGALKDFSSEEKRIAAMGSPAYTKGNYELYVDKITGEVAIKDTVTGDILFTNPFDLAEIPLTAISQTTKMELLSQVQISYTENGVTKKYNSFKDSALLQQIKVKRLNGGIRIEYSIGEEESRTLVPRVISETRFRTMILEQMAANLAGGTENRTYKRIAEGWWGSAPYTAENATPSVLLKFPIIADTEKFPEGIRVFDESAKKREIKQVESWIKAYAPNYTYEELDKDHRETGYNAKNIAPANFKMALEYYLTDTGVEVRFPANGLAFDETNYSLNSVDILRVMGAGSNVYNGYTMIPDGSGTLIRYEDTSRTFDFTAKVYGQDYAYQNVGSANQEVYRLPVFGAVTTAELQDNANIMVSNAGADYWKQYASGFVAIVTEGDALTSITTSHGGNVEHCYNSVFCSFTPRPKDQYYLSDVISIVSSTTAAVEVVSDRKYTGSFRINYIMLTDPENPAFDPETDYDTSYVGMAKAYRDYLEKKGDLTRIEASDKDIPLYVEVFGLTETDESILSIPVTVKKALTSFKDMEIMTEELAAAKSPIKNVNFRLTGFTNGGMRPTVPTSVKFEKVVGGNAGFRDFLDYAVEKGIGVYPDFDFAYMATNELTDGFRYSRDAIKTIDDRYTTKRTYDPVLQSFSTTGRICISPCVYRSYFEKFNKSMTKLLKGKTTNISVGTLGSELNSDFDKDDPYNREDSKEFTIETLKQISANYGKTMIDAGNAYAIPYASVVLNAPLDSSRYLKASESIPFYGLVFHGYVVIAGKPTNMAGDVKYETLKILENGATLYMMLSYENVELLKEDKELSQYYAISYEIWKDTLLTQYDESGNVTSVGIYDKLNGALKDVQASRIIDHKFIDCKRQLTDEEMKNITIDSKAAYNADYSAYEAQYDYYVARIADYDRIVADYDPATAADLLNKYGIANKLALETKRDEIKAKMDALDLDSYIKKNIAKIDLNVTDGSVVFVEYENGHWFVLNYNNFVIEATVTPSDGVPVNVTVAAKDFHDPRAAA